MPGEPDYIADLKRAAKIRLLPRTDSPKPGKSDSIPKAWVEELALRLNAILNDASYSNSQKIAMMRIETDLLRQATNER